MFPSWRSRSAFEDMIRSGGVPSRCSCRSAAEWKVRAVTPPTPSRSSRSLISVAALSVKVTARISCGSNSPIATWFAMRRVIVVVFPEPCAGKDADRAAHGLDGAALLGVQPGEDAINVHGLTLRTG